MATALDIARCLLQIASSDREPDYLSPMRLQKLLYYVQGWSLAVRGRGAFSEPIEAWKHGPVVMDVYQAFKEFGNTPILHSLPCEVSDEDREFVRRIWEHYREFSPAQLYRMTHEEPAWKEARKDLSPDEKSNAALNPDTMREFFVNIDLSRIPGLEPERLKDAEEKLARGETISFDELVNR